MKVIRRENIFSLPKISPGDRGFACGTRISGKLGMRKFFASLNRWINVRINHT
jgi:hypothetical protein